MAISNHPDYASESKRLEETREYLENTIRTVIEKRSKFKEEIKQAYIDLDFLDSSLSYSTIMLNSTLLDALEKNFDLLLDARKKPYFARMDIKQEGKERLEKLYIGKVTLTDTSMEIPMVVDWRAPIASVYYDGRLGETSYVAGKVEHTIDLLLKRQYTIEDGQLLNFMDVDISTSDAFLQASLEGHAGERLKDIVATIQAEQNQIIRADIEKPLIVQGVAGSGKTTIALHRIAYLIYTYADTFTPEEFMIIAPNNLFLDYISGVLPELGANRVTQTTYVDLMKGIIGKKIKLIDPNKKLNELIRTDKQAMPDGEKALLRAAAAFKNSMAMKDAMDQYIANVEGKIIPGDDFCLDDVLLLSSEEVSELFYKKYGYQEPFKRVVSIKKYLTTYTRKKTKEILKDIEESYAEKITRARRADEPSEEKRLNVVALMDEREERVDRIAKRAKTVVKKYMCRFYSTDLFSCYYEMLSNLQAANGSSGRGGILSYMANQSEMNRESKQFEIEDLAPMVYLKQKLYGLDEPLDVKMVVIDEAQDFSNFQFYVLRQLLNTSRFTILGDLSQGIHMYRAIEDWEYLRNNIFPKETNYLTLEQSYRTTIEIMDEANYVLSQAPLEHIIKARPVVRHGDKPVVEQLDSKHEVIERIVEQIKQWSEEKLTTMAVIAKSNQEAKAIHKLLSKENRGLNIALVDEKTSHFDHRVLVIPAHLAKGLEFDAVIVTAIDESYENEPLDVKLMYVAMTRAMHRLAVLCQRHSIAYYRGGQKDRNGGQ